MLRFPSEEMLASRGRCRWTLLLAALAGVTGACSTPPADSKPAAATTTPPPHETIFEPPPPRLRRLIAREYVGAVRELLGDEAAAAVVTPPDSALAGLAAIGASELTLDDNAVVTYESSARAAAAVAVKDVARMDALAGCTPSSPDDAACRAQLVSRFGRLAWRRPLTQEEIDAFAGTAAAATAVYGDFYSGSEHAIAALLNAPSFLYQVEYGDPASEADGKRRLTGLEVATRMAFFLNNASPDEALLDAAEAGELDTADGVRAHARELLTRPEARGAVEGFYAELFRLNELDGLIKVPALYPAFTPELARAMKEETLRLVDDIVWDRNADFRELFTADYSFVNADLAALYGVPAPSGSGFSKIATNTEEGRAGVLGQAGFLSVFAHQDGTSPTYRGKFVRERLLCQTILPPPKDVVAKLPPANDTQTMRQRLEQHRTDPSCSGCHTDMDGIGLAFENFDGIGAYRAKENGVEIDASGEMPGVGTFYGVKELGALLHEQPDLTNCTVLSLYRQSVSHVETVGELDAIDALITSFKSSGYKLQDLLVEMVASDAFRVVGTEP